MRTGSYSIAKLLASKYTTFLTMNKEGETPLDVASARNRKALYVLIENARLGQITEPNEQPEGYFRQTSETMLTALKNAIMRSEVLHYQMPTTRKLPRLHTFPIGRSKSSVPHTIRQQVNRLLEKEETRGWAVLCVSLGVTEDDAVPAIVVIHPMAERLWQAISHRARGVEYLVEKGTISRQSSSASELRLFQREPMNGSSIGSVSNETNWGSLGGYLKLKNGDVVAMTCGHVLTQKDKHDVSMVCVQPSIYHLKSQGDGIETSVLNASSIPTCLGENQESNAHIPDHQFQDMLENRIQRGCTCFSPASCPYFGMPDSIDVKIGTRIRPGKAASQSEYITFSMDWAILKNLSRAAKKNMIHGKVVSGWKALAYDVNGESEVLVGNDQRVYMQGARSGESQGVLDSRLADCHFEENYSPTKEIGIFGCDGEPFSAPGDSGSWVIEVSEEGNGSVIGVLIGGYYNGIACISLMTPMEDLLADISSTLRIEIKDIRCSWS
ncbi:hypothetical protein BKA60DRAFT_500700 [Fusarium oxysporum]|nr:hypothetical protein BKA60DRAFT_500700 [Fusarium oxysporum]